MTPTTDYQTRSREALTSRHFEVLRETITKGHNYANLGTELSQHLIELQHAGYLYSWQGIFYATDPGKAAASQ